MPLNRSGRPRGAVTYIRFSRRDVAELANVRPDGLRRAMKGAELVGGTRGLRLLVEFLAPRLAQPRGRRRG